MKAYITRDKNDDVYLWTSKPVKGPTMWLEKEGNYSHENKAYVRQSEARYFVNIKWTDTEPYSIDV